MIIIGLSNSRELARKVAKKLKVKYSSLDFEQFPDGEVYLRFRDKVKGKNVVLIQSMQPRVNDALIETLFASATAKDLGAKKVILVAPYLSYMRQDKRFKPGECISNEIVAKFIDDYVDQVFVVDPHLHRDKSLSVFFKIKSTKLTANPLIAAYIKKKIKNPLLIGPDWESYKWARATAEMIGAESVILKKKRYSGRRVKVYFGEKIDVKGKNAVLVDDMISTGGTLLRTIEHLKKLGLRKFTCVAVHGVFSEGALGKLKKAGATVITANTIENPTAKLDISGIIADALK
ncbi:ribose-phosphate diphosphokinase [Nanoarchaeota archaeon]